MPHKHNFVPEYQAQSISSFVCAICGANIDIAQACFLIDEFYEEWEQRKRSWEVKNAS